MAQEMILRQAAELAQLRGEVAQLKATVEELARRLARNSRNSSQPPSTDPPQAQSPRVRREASGRRPGGQPGHEGQTRALVPVEAVDVVIPLKPVWCTHCHHLLLGADPQPERHQVTEIPPVRPVITEYQLHQVVCPACGEATRAGLAVGLAPGGFWPRV
jgi:transposase